MVQPRTGSDQQTACASVEFLKCGWTGTSLVAQLSPRVETHVLDSDDKHDCRKRLRDRPRRNRGPDCLHTGNRKLLPEPFGRMMMQLLRTVVVMRMGRCGLLFQLRQHRPAMAEGRERQTRDK